jgi:hypothetical protein
VAAYTERPDDQANQGDIFVDVPFAVPPLEGVAAYGMIVSHDCDCDKFLKPKSPIPDEQVEVWPITMAPVHPIAFLTGGRQKAVRENRMPRYFHLPADDEMAELVADLWLEQPVPIHTVLQCKRASSLSDEWRGKLQAQIVRLRTGVDVSTLAAMYTQKGPA